MPRSGSKKAPRSGKKAKTLSRENGRSALVAKLRDHDDAESILATFDALADERDNLASERDNLASERDSLASERDAMAAEYERQELRIKQLKMMLYGRRTEKLTRVELQQLMLAFGANEEQAKKPDPEVPVPTPPNANEGDDTDPDSSGDSEGTDDPKPKKPRKRRRRTEVSSEVERVVDTVFVPASERACACCHEEMSAIGHVERRWLEWVPAKFIEHVERREKLACRNSQCRGDIHTAERPDESPERRKVDAGLLAQLVEAKCSDGLPVDRQRDMFSRLGVAFPLNTLYSYWTYVTTLLWPVAQIVLARVLADSIVGVDDTKLRILNKGSPGGSYKACLWCFTGTGPLVAFKMTRSWKADDIAETIAAIDGNIQCDDYKGYGAKITMPDGTVRVLVDPERRLGCMMHVRRRFYDALKLGDKRAATAVQWIKGLYEIEAEAKLKGLCADERLALREEKSLPILDQLEAWVDEMSPKCVPNSPLGRALGYAEHQRPFVRRCFTDGRFEIDNGHTERMIRRPAVGRKNYLFSGAFAAAERLAGAYTLVLSCRNLGLDIRVYLVDVIRKLEGGWPLSKIDELTPDRWAALHPEAVTVQKAG